MSKNGKIRLDLTDLIEPIELTFGDYVCEVSGDMSLTAMGRMAKAFGKISADADISIEDLGISESEMWELIEEIMSHATPKPPTTARELMTTQAAIKVLTFLASRTTDGLTKETTSSKK